MTDAGHTYLHPGYKKPYPVETVLRDLAAQEGCDGEPYDAMVFAAETITTLRAQLAEARADTRKVVAAVTNPSGQKCEACRETGAYHCSDPINCGGMIDVTVDEAIALVSTQKARADRAEAELAALSDPLVVGMNMLNGRIAKPCVTGILHIYAGELVSLEQLQAALAAQIEADAGIVIGMKGHGWDENPATHPYDKGYIGACDAAVNRIRNQPHDRTALDRMLAEAREKALREAYDSLFKHPGFIHAISGQKFKAVKLEDAAEGILALIEKPNAG